MRYFVVFQNKTFYEEKVGGYLWAPKANKQGRSMFHWSNMRKVKKGDIVFSSCKSSLVSINIAASDCYSFDKPIELDYDDLWERIGWRVDLNYYELINSFKFKDYIDKLCPILPSKYSPFNADGRGAQGYLFEIGSKPGEFLLNIAFKFNKGLSEKFTKYQSEKTNVTKPTIIEQVITQTIVKNIENKVNEYKDEGSVKEEIQLDTYKNRLFYLLSKFKFNDNEMANFQNASYCMYRFNISNPLISASFYGFKKNLIQTMMRSFFIGIKLLKLQAINIISVSNQKNIGSLL